MSNVSVNKQDGAGYAPKMDMALSQTVGDWWKGLTKIELLQYIHDQPGVTADDIRRMLANEGVTLEFGLKFSASSTDVVTNFYSEER